MKHRINVLFIHLQSKELKLERRFKQECKQQQYIHISIEKNNLGDKLH